MDIQSFSVVVPNKECINKCPFCVSRMVNSNIYPNKMDVCHPTYDYNVKEYMRRMQYVANTGCQTLILTGTSEPQQNKQFLNTFALIHRLLGKPFTNIEMQSTGMLLDDQNYLRFLKNFVCVNTMALSISAPVPKYNAQIIGHPFDGSYGRSVDFVQVIKLMKQYGFNIRLCFNLSDYFKFENVPGFFDWCSDSLQVDQVTFRVLYSSDAKTPQAKWIKEHMIIKDSLKRLTSFLMKFEPVGETLYGASIRYVNGMSVIFDDDCMGKNPTRSAMKYLILRPNCKLYASWDNPASLVF